MITIINTLSAEEMAKKISELKNIKELHYSTSYHGMERCIVYSVLVVFKKEKVK